MPIETEEQIRERKAQEKRERDEQELEEQRKKIWLSIARKDIPRVGDFILFSPGICWHVAIRESAQVEMMGEV